MRIVVDIVDRRDEASVFSSEEKARAAGCVVECGYPSAATEIEFFEPEDDPMAAGYVCRVTHARVSGWVLTSAEKWS